jgi:hypothetical protein
MVRETPKIRGVDLFLAGAETVETLELEEDVGHGPIEAERHSVEFQSIDRASLECERRLAWRPAGWDVYCLSFQ